jgi:microsomal dipeptidase-like Zn-dependent dipeptidase
MTRLTRVPPAASLIASTVVLGALVACSPAPEPLPLRAVATVDELMDHVITPAAEIYWGAVSIIVDFDGITENFPRTDEEWERVRGAALALAESGNLLMIAPRAPDSGDWLRLSAELIDAGVAAAEVASARDVDGVFDLSERIYNVCQACHEQYLVDPAALTFLPSD